MIYMMMMMVENKKGDKGRENKGQQEKKTYISMELKLGKGGNLQGLRNKEKNTKELRP
jgi:hypothetical protein